MPQYPRLLTMASQGDPLPRGGSPQSRCRRLSLRPAERPGLVICMVLIGLVIGKWPLATRRSLLVASKYAIQGVPEGSKAMVTYRPMSLAVSIAEQDHVVTAQPVPLAPTLVATFKFPLVVS